MTNNIRQHKETRHSSKVNKGVFWKHTSQIQPTSASSILWPGTLTSGMGPGGPGSPGIPGNPGAPETPCSPWGPAGPSTPVVETP